MDHSSIILLWFAGVFAAFSATHNYMFYPLSLSPKDRLKYWGISPNYFKDHHNNQIASAAVKITV